MYYYHPLFPDYVLIHRSSLPPMLPDLQSLMGQLGQQVPISTYPGQGGQQVPIPTYPGQGGQQHTSQQPPPVPSVIRARSQFLLSLNHQQKQELVRRFEAGEQVDLPISREEYSFAENYERISIQDLLKSGCFFTWSNVLMGQALSVVELFIQRAFTGFGGASFCETWLQDPSTPTAPPQFVRGFPVDSIKFLKC